MKNFITAGLLSSVLLAGCGTHSADVEACEHLQEGPATSVTATASATGAPAVNNDHKRYDVALVDVTGGKGGTVTFASPEAADYVVFLNADMPLKVATSSGAAVAHKAGATSSAECTEVKARHTYALGVGTYTLSFGPAAASSVSLVIEEETQGAQGHGGH